MLTSFRSPTTIPFDINSITDFPPLPSLSTAQAKTVPQKVHQPTPPITQTPPPTYTSNTSPSPPTPPPQIQIPRNNEIHADERGHRDSTPSARAPSLTTHEPLTQGRADSNTKPINPATPPALPPIQPSPISIHTSTTPLSPPVQLSTTHSTTPPTAHLAPSRDTARTPLSSPATASADAYEEVDECARSPPHASPRYTSATHGVVCAEKDRVGDVGGAQKVLDNEYAFLRDWGLRSAVLVGGVVVAVAVGVGFCARMRG